MFLHLKFWFENFPCNCHLEWYHKHSQGLYPFLLVFKINAMLEANSFWNVVLVLNIGDNGKSPGECWWYYFMLKQCKNVCYYQHFVQSILIFLSDCDTYIFTFAIWKNFISYSIIVPTIQSGMCRAISLILSLNTAVVVESLTFEACICCEFICHISPTFELALYHRRVLKCWAVSMEVDFPCLHVL